MNAFFPTLLDGLRAAFLRQPRGSALLAGPAPFVAMLATYLLVSFGMDWIGTGDPWRFDAGGVVTVLTDALLTLLAAWLLCSLARRPGIVWGAAAILLAATVATAVAIHWPLASAGGALVGRGQVAAAMALELVARGWWFLVLLVFAHWLAPRGLGRVLGAAVLAYAVSAAAWWWLPAATMVDVAADRAAAVDDTGTPAADDTDAGTSADEADSFDAEKVMYDQPALLDAALAKLAPPRPGRPDLYVVAFAGDGSEDVFRNEVEYAGRLFARRFDAAGHVLVLENNPATVATQPLATWTNLHRALGAIAGRMDPAEDILLLYLTTHGSADHELLVDLDPLPLDQIEPVDIADALKTTPAIRWKVLVVNACYSGGFIDALRDDSTLVMTSARTDRTSFGCGVDSDITYFGRAFLVDALNQTTSLRDAFDLAKKSVLEWEDADKQEHSEPQIATSPSIEAKLADWRQRLVERPNVPFQPAAKSR